MLREHQDHIVVLFGLTFEPPFGFVNRLSRTFEAAQEKLKKQLWSFAVDRYYLRDLQDRYFVSFEFNRLGFTSLGLNSWTKNYEELGSIYRSSLDIMGTEQVKAIAFRPMMFLPMGMTHAEIVDLLFGSYLIKSRHLDNICGATDDALVQLHGKIKGMRIRTIIAPMNAEQAAANFMAQPGFELLIDPKNYDSGLKEARDRMARDCLMLDIEVSRENTNADGIQTFVKESLEVADSVAENSIALLKSTQSKGEVGNGSAKQKPR